VADTPRRSGWPTNRHPQERGRPAETLRGRFSAPLATTSSARFTLSNILERYWTIGAFRPVDLPTGGASAFEAWRRRSS